VLGGLVLGGLVLGGLVHSDRQRWFEERR